MDKHGMYPQHPCKVCGKPLNDDGGHPAELYAGTYTGLCYKCERGPAYLVRVQADGAEVWSHPPTCPSHSRDRTEHIGYPGCLICKGKGKITVFRAAPLGGSYGAYCETCLTRWENHPERKRLNWTYRTIRERAQEIYEGLLRKARIITKARKGTAPPEKIAEFRAEAQAWLAKQKQLYQKATSGWL